MNNKKLVEELKEYLVEQAGDIVDRVVLFGSRAGRTEQGYSDYDVLVVLKSDYDWRKEREIYDLCYDIDLKYDILIDVKIISLAELETLRGKQPYIQRALESGIRA